MKGDIMEYIGIALVFDGLLFCCSCPSIFGKICDILGL
jgi:hypothetical protein